MEKTPAVRAAASAACLLAIALLCSGCATLRAGWTMPAAPPTPVIDPALLADFVQQLPVGSRIRIDRVRGASLTATLMHASPDAIIVLPSTQEPAPPITIPMAEIARVTMASANHPGSAFAGGVLGAVCGLLLLFVIAAASAGN